LLGFGKSLFPQKIAFDLLPRTTLKQTKQISCRSEIGLKRCAPINPGMDKFGS